MARCHSKDRLWGQRPSCSLQSRWNAPPSRCFIPTTSSTNQTSMPKLQLGLAWASPVPGHIWCGAWPRTGLNNAEWRSTPSSGPHLQKQLATSPWKWVLSPHFYYYAWVALLPKLTISDVNSHTYIYTHVRVLNPGLQNICAPPAWFKTQALFLAPCRAWTKTRPISGAGLSVVT